MQRILPVLTEPGLPTLRGAVWALRALRRLRREIGNDGLEAYVVPPPKLRSGGVRGVEAALRRRRATCLERSLIVQRWLVAHGEWHDVLVGVSGGSESMEAHAWVESYDAQDQGEGFRVLTRVAPSG
jgi:Transglutaminase-like superfamily